MTLFANRSAEEATVDLRGIRMTVACLVHQPLHCIVWNTTATVWRSNVAPSWQLMQRAGDGGAILAALHATGRPQQQCTMYARRPKAVETALCCARVRGGHGDSLQGGLSWQHCMVHEGG